MDFNRERELRRFNDIRKALKENNEKLRRCTLHDFDTNNIRLGQNIKCKKCGAEVPLQYYAGYKDLKEKLLDTEKLINFINALHFDGKLNLSQRKLMQFILEGKLPMQEDYDLEAITKLLVKGRGQK